MDENGMVKPANWSSRKSIIKVIGVGGGGSNAVSEMFRTGIKDVEFMICNTDVQALESSEVGERIALGSDITRGLGAGCDPERGRKAASESVDAIKNSLKNGIEMTFITAGMGGGTGTGAAPVVAQVSKEMGLLTVGVVTLPFRDEGKEFVRRAIKGIKELQKHVDSLLIIDNQKLYEVYGDLTVVDAFPKVDAVLNTAVKSIAELITKRGYINVDFADVKMIMKDGGMAIMGEGEADGPDRAIEAVQRAFESPLLNDCDLSTVKGALVNITSSKEEGNLTMAELSQIMDYVNNYTGNQVNKFKRGVVFDEAMGTKIRITIVATGFNVQNLPLVSEDDEEIVVMGDRYSNSFSAPSTGTVKRVVIDEETINDVQQPSQDTSNYSKTGFVEAPHTEEISTVIPKQEVKPYERPKVKPALILEADDDITLLETVPAFKRRNLAKRETESRAVSADHNFNGTQERMKLEEVDGIQTIETDNSFLHRTQD